MRNRSHPDHTSVPARPRRRLIAGAATTAVALGIGALIAPAAAQAADPVTIDLVTVNDFHGRISASAPSGGIAALATAVQQIRDTNPNTVFAAAGDMIGASTFESFIQQDLPTIETLNAAGLDVSAVGNHEFDRGWADLEGRVQDAADWEYLGANVYDRATDAPALTEQWTQTFDGVTIGFIGAVTEALPSLVNPDGIAELEVRPIVDEVNRVADGLRDGDPANGEADVVVLLVHEGAATTDIASATDDSAFGRIVSGVDQDVNAIVSGHTHLAYNHVIDGRPVISSGQYGEKFSDMKIVVDPETKAIQSMTNTIYSMFTTPPPPAVPIANYAPDADIAAMVQVAVDESTPLGAVPLGTISADFNRAKLPPVGTAAPAENRGAESTLGNFVADAQLWSAQRADASTQIAFMNPGGLRADMVFAPDGVLTYKEAAAVQPFANTLVNVTLTGAQVKEALEQQWQPEGAARPFLKLGVSKSLTYVFDPAAAVGSHITQVKLDGVDIDPAGSYRVVVNSFLAAGGDNFPAFSAGADKRDTGKIDLESMVDYMAFLKAASPDQAQRSIGVTASAPGAAGYLVGGSIDLALSALEFSTTETVGGTVDVAIGGVPVGSAPIDRTPVAASDQGGTAALTVTVPAGVSGVVPLTISVASTGTTFEVPITVVQPEASTIVGWPSRLLARSGTTVSYTAVVTAQGDAVPTGTVTVYDGSTAIATGELTDASNGRVTVTLPALGKGLHRLSAIYGGSDLVKASRSFTLPLIIW